MANSGLSDRCAVRRMFGLGMRGITPVRFIPFCSGLPRFDQCVYEIAFRQDHYLRKVLEVIPWSECDDRLAGYDSDGLGRPAESATLMLKLEFLRYHHNLSDREVIARAETDLSFRFFLQLPLRWNLPIPDRCAYSADGWADKAFGKYLT